MGVTIRLKITFTKALSATADGTPATYTVVATGYDTNLGGAIWGDTITRSSTNCVIEFYSSFGVNLKLATTKWTWAIFGAKHKA